MNTIKKPLYTVPLASMPFESGRAHLLSDMIRYNYDRGGKSFRGGLRFKGIRAIKTHSQIASGSWHIAGAYDTLVEIKNSPWIKELGAETADRQRWIGEKWKMRHYMIYLDGLGAFEVAAESWEVLPEKPGAWPDPMAN